MKKIAAPQAPKPAPKPPPKERKPLVIETKGFEGIADAMVKATTAQGDATAALQEVVATLTDAMKPRAFEVEIKRDLAGIMTKLIISPVHQKGSVRS